MLIAEVLNADVQSFNVDSENSTLLAQGFYAVFSERLLVMKFGKLLQSWAATEANPAHGELFLRFKELKKTLKLIKPLEADADGQELVLDSAEPALDASSSREPTQAQQQGPTQPDSPEAMAEERTFLQTLREVSASGLFCLPEALGLCWTILRTIEED